MKKLALTFAIVLGLSLSSFAGGGIFQRGIEAEEETNNNRSGYFNYYDIFRDRGTDDLPGLPAHGEDDNMNAPLGGGALLLIGFGAAYAAAKRRKE